MSKNIPQENNLKLPALAVALVVAFLPALLRAIGFEIIPPTSNMKVGEAITLLPTVLGSVIVAQWLRNVLKPRYPRFANLLGLLSGFAIAILAWVINVFSMFAF